MIDHPKVLCVLDEADGVSAEVFDALQPFSAWSFLRDALARGAAIQQDYAAGNHASYDAYSARLDGVARELADRLRPHLAKAAS